jgi:DNA-binding SARP family transcriptional activator/tetratricopeptide (TPR) repeat protein
MRQPAQRTVTNRSLIAHQLCVWPNLPGTVFLVGSVMELGVLGPFEVRIDHSEAVALGGRRQRALLVILALHANEVVSTDRLIDQLWGESPPATGLHTIQVFVSRLRGALGSAGNRLITRPPGYLLDVRVDELDADRCDRRYASARAALAAGEPERAKGLLVEAEGLWRGPPLAEFTYEPFAQPEIARLEELRVSCREELIEAELALGRHAEVVSDLEGLVREHPFRERPRGQLMLALHRSGRQAEALAVFQQTRRLLVDELAVEPSGPLRRLEQAILRQDPALDGPLPAAAAPEAAPAADEPAPATPEAKPPPARARETVLRKTATVLVARLVAPPDTDPEIARTQFAVARSEIRRIVGYHGGVFVSGLGGEVVGVFGLPITREDDALRAVRAADELRARVVALSDNEPSEVVVGVGVDTGEVVAEAPGDMFGQPLVGAVALAGTASEGEVLLSDATRRFVAKAARVEPAPDATGWRLVEIGEQPPGLRQRPHSPMVDRVSELAAAQMSCERAAREGGAQLLTVLGDAGIGKSRLAQELVNQLGDQATVLTGRCLSYGEGVAFWPMREALTKAAGGESRDAIRTLVGSQENAALIADVVAATIGLTPGETLGEQVPWAFRRLLEALAQQRPLVLVIDDAHWAEPPLLDLIEYFVDWLRAPVQLLCLARPELLDVRPGFGGGRPRVSSLVLGPLSDDDARQLVTLHLGQRSQAAAVAARILQTAEGSPLFVEQLLAMSAEDPSWDATREIPPTIHSLLAARLDRLGPAERAFIERAAVIGREFWPRAVIELLSADARSSAEPALRTLVHRGLIQPQPSVLAGEEQLRFHHILIRDVAYRSIPKRQRSELHERFADWLAKRGESYDEFVGFHLEQALSCGNEVGRPQVELRPLAERAAESLSIAGRRALARGETNAGVKLLQGSADLFEVGGRARPQVLLDLGGALSERGDFGEAERVLQAAVTEARQAGAEAVGARALIELSFQRALIDPSIPVEEMLTVADEAVAVFNRLGDDGGIARAWQHVAIVHWIRSRGAEMEQVLERALVHAERAGEKREQSRILGYLARVCVTGPLPVDEGVQRCTAILERAGDDAMLTSVTETMLGVLEAMRGRFDEARDHWSRGKRRLESVGLSVTLAAMQMYSAFIELMAETPQKAEPGVAEAYSLLEGIGEGHRRAMTAAVLGRLLFAQGRIAEAERYLEISEATASEDDVGTQVIWRGTRARIVAQAGVPRLAERLAGSAVKLASQTDYLMLHGDALRDRANVSLVLGRNERAAHDLEQAIALYERKGIRVSAEAASREYAAFVADTGCYVNSGSSGD